MDRTYRCDLEWESGKLVCDAGSRHQCRCAVYILIISRRFPGRFWLKLNSITPMGSQERVATADTKPKGGEGSAPVVFDIVIPLCVVEEYTMMKLSKKSKYAWLAMAITASLLGGSVVEAARTMTNFTTPLTGNSDNDIDYEGAGVLDGSTYTFSKESTIRVSNADAIA